MSKLSKKGKVHPSLAPNLSILPATIVTLAAALSPEDKEVLAYLISWCGSTSNNTTADNHRTIHRSGDGGHSPLFDCNCFRCYKSYWARWDTSPNRQLIHEILEAYEEALFRENYNRRSLKKKMKKKRGKRVCDEFRNGEPGSPEVNSSGGSAATASEDLHEGHHQDEDGIEVEAEKGSLTKIVNFLGEKIFGIFGV